MRSQRRFRDLRRTIHDEEPCFPGRVTWERINLVDVALSQGANGDGNEEDCRNSEDRCCGQPSEVDCEVDCEEGHRYPVAQEESDHDSGEDDDGRQDHDGQEDHR